MVFLVETAGGDPSEGTLGLRKDGDGKLVSHRARGLDKITLNCLLSVRVMQAKMVARHTCSLD